MYEEEEHDLPHGAGDEDCAPTRLCPNSHFMEQNSGIDPATMYIP